MEKWVIVQKLVHHRQKAPHNNIIKLVPKTYKPPPITTCGVNDIQNLVTILTREVPDREQQLKTFATVT